MALELQVLELNFQLYNLYLRDLGYGPSILKVLCQYLLRSPEASSIIIYLAFLVSTCAFPIFCILSSIGSSTTFFINSITSFIFF